MPDDTAPLDQRLLRISLLNKLLICVVLAVWALNLIPPIWLVSSRRLLPAWLRMPSWMLVFTVQKAEDSIRMQNAIILHNYGAALENYARAHNGRFPRELDDLVPEFLSTGQARPYCDIQNGELKDWIYFPGYTTSSPGNPILFAAPVTDVSGRISYTLDQKAGTVAEIKYQQLLQQQPPREW